jgi:tRNA threonylcarbamoyladenosine biosynthesis protein TsaE
LETVSSGPVETEALGADLARGLGPGDIVLVSGELGTGKTTLIRGACRALGVSEDVTSPTFTIGHRYRGRVPVSHVDLYRLEAAEREDPALLDDYLDSRGICFVEWPEGRAESFGALSGVRHRVRLEHAGGDDRRIEISG